MNTNIPIFRGLSVVTQGGGKAGGFQGQGDEPASQAVDPESSTGRVAWSYPLDVARFRYFRFFRQSRSLIKGIMAFEVSVLVIA
ncbi:hypothetical protein UWK_00469 [Desulfocapsa sulfexigens DSM 10523]|uniref:Uncharacterized protein n=1 Tax=Desulfocapsa sulfexigens (strain DSM 10523 / SB164P1) TaxID=1167006 RepID=M1P5V0_DESSD|nr:hypothetical protein UWK_00469 [Desulfocapsa sulfexigens DSM 10523]